jgi:CspA family cold shock protein
MPSGFIKRWIDDRGFGFIKPDAGGPDVFVHVKALPPGAEPREGMGVSFEIANDSTRGKTQAVNVRLCAPMQRSL